MRRIFLALLVGLLCFPLTASLQVNQLVGFGGGGDYALSGSFTDHAVDTTNSASYSFSNRNVGTPTASRKVVVCVSGNPSGGTNFTAFTIGGVTATQRALSVGGTSMGAIYDAPVPSGATATIAFTWNGTLSNAGIGVAAVYNAALTPTATATAINDPMNTTLTIPANGIGIGCGMDRSTSTFTWTNLTEAYDETVEGIVTQTGALRVYPTLQTSLSITCDPSNAATNPIMALVSYAPAT